MAGPRSPDTGERTAAAFVERLNQHQSDEELRKIQRYFKSGNGEYGEGDAFIGVRMGDVFGLAKEFIELPPEAIEILLDSPIHEVRAGALSIMDKQARRKRTPEARRKELYDLYLRRIDRVNNWDLVDVSCPFVIGGYLFDFNKPRDILYTLARSGNLWERRTAIVSTSFFMRQGETADTFAIAEILLQDDEDLIHKAVGGWLRAAGDVDRNQLESFLDAHAASMPRTMLRYAIEHFEKDGRDAFLRLRESSRSS